MRKLVLFLISVWALLPAAAGAQGLITKGETVDIGRCIAIALERQPSILAAAGTLRAGESRIGQAQAGYYPQLNGSAGYSRIDPISTSGGQAYNNYSSTVTLNQNIYDFGKTSTQVRVQEFSRNSFRSDLENVRTLVVFSVKQAYYGLLQAGRNRDVNREVVDQFQKHLDQARAFFEVGTKSKIDVTKAEVDLSNAKLTLLQAENTFRLAQVSLNNAIGLPDAPDYAVVDMLSYEPMNVDLDATLRMAYDRRPDLLSLAARKKSLDESIALARKGYYPSISGNANYSWGGNDFPLGRGWSLGATVDIPIFSGYSTKYQIAEAQANLDVVAANEASLRQTIYQDVKQAWLNLAAAADQIAAAELTVRQAMENLDLANGRYGAGVGSPLEVTDAVVAASNAKTAYTSALYNYRIAQASLEKATGER